MTIKLSSTPTCVLTDADNISPEQKLKIAMVLLSGIPTTSGDGPKTLIIDENGDPKFVDYQGEDPIPVSDIDNQFDD